MIIMAFAGEVAAWSVLRKAVMVLSGHLHAFAGSHTSMQLLTSASVMQVYGRTAK